MASSAGAARDTRVDDLDHLSTRALEANMQGRYALATTLFSRAEILASQLHPDDTYLIRRGCVACGLLHFTSRRRC